MKGLAETYGAKPGKPKKPMFGGRRAALFGGKETPAEEAVEAKGGGLGQRARLALMMARRGRWK